MKIKEAAIIAQLAGEPTFEHPKLCRVCGGSERYSNSTSCVKCHKQRAIKAYKALGDAAKDRARKRQAEWRDKNREYHRAYERARYAKRREQAKAEQEKSRGLRFL